MREKAANAIILGSSRAGSSLDVEHTGWDGLNAYNFALPGVDPYLLWRSLQHARANGELKRVLLTFDFYMFNAYFRAWGSADRQAYEERLSVNPSEHRNYRYPMQWFKDMNALLLSFDTLQDSWNTIHVQPTAEDDRARANTVYDSGFWVADIPPVMAQRSVFHSIEKQYMTTMWFPDPGHKFALSDASQSSRLEYTQRILAECYRDNIDVTLVFMPFHARLAEAMHAVDIWTLFEQWKKDVIVVNEREAKENDRPAYLVWDFTGYNSITMETVPPRKDRHSRMRWHTDASHISKAAGDLMQDRIWLGENATAPDFGRLVNSSNIDDVIRDDNEARSVYIETFEADVQEVKNIAHRTRLQRSDQ